jgi:hypothetical protein
MRGVESAAVCFAIWRGDPSIKLSDVLRPASTALLGLAHSVEISEVAVDELLRHAGSVPRFLAQDRWRGADTVPRILRC